MGWNKLAPIARSSGRPMASASIVVSKAGEAKLVLILSASIYDEYGSPQVADVSAGEGEDAGSLLIEFTEAGAFKLTNFAKGGARLFLPVPEGAPAAARTNMPAPLGARTDASLVVVLPLDDWSRAAAIPRGGSSVKPPPDRNAATVPLAEPVGNGKPLDMVEYLATKGVKISRLAAGRFSIAGETVGQAVVLKMVNDRRKAGDLDPLPAHKVF